MDQGTYHLNGPFRARDKRDVDQFVSDYFYKGELELPADGRKLFFHLEQIASRPCPLYSLATAGEYGWRRTSADIRLDGSDFCAVRLLLAGRATITQGGRTIAMLPGEIIINRSTLPIRVNISPAPCENRVSMLIALLPSAVLQEQIDIGEAINRSLPTQGSHYRLVVDLMQMLQARHADIDDETGEFLANAFFSEVAKLAATIAAPATKVQGVSAERLAQVRGVIRTHFANPSLSLDLIARKCGISPRYVTYVMRKFGTSFYDELRVERLNAARRMLQSRNLPIKQVAYYTGFKSAAHFSAAYKREFGHPPSSEAASPASEVLQ